VPGVRPGPGTEDGDHAGCDHHGGVKGPGASAGHRAGGPWLDWCWTGGTRRRCGRRRGNCGPRVRSHGPGGEPPSAAGAARTHMPPHTDANAALSYKGHSRRCHDPAHRRSWWPRRSRSAGGPAGDNASALGAEPLVPLGPAAGGGSAGGAGDNVTAPFARGPRRPAGASGGRRRGAQRHSDRRWRRTPPGAATAPARPRSTICRGAREENRGSECGGWIRASCARALRGGRPDDADFDKRVPPEQVARSSCGCWTARRPAPVRGRKLRESGDGGRRVREVRRGGRTGWHGGARGVRVPPELLPRCRRRTGTRSAAGRPAGDRRR